MAISKKPYIGSRDFYPEDMRLRNWMFATQRRICETYGYGEYAAPLLEPLELYRMKSSDEIVNDQVYRFTDRGDREVAIRPEMTPTLARMASARLAELPRPLRWFSIANFMRYERPGRGRLREFYQLNVDLLGEGGAAADAEIMMLAIDILRAYGATPDMFRLRYSDRRLLEGFLEPLGADRRRETARLLDKRAKIDTDEFDRELQKLIPDSSVRAALLTFLDTPAGGIAKLQHPAARNLADSIAILEAHGYADFLEFDPAIVRGFDYYTGFVFEIFDLNPENRRSLFGGGRYDRLIGLFGKEDLPAVGFGLGDVTLQNFLEAHSLVDAGVSARSGAYLVAFGEEQAGEILSIAREIRAADVCVEVGLEPTKKLGKQFELADRKGRRFVLIVGPEELAAGVVRVKDLSNGTQADVPRGELAVYLQSQDSR